MFEDILDKNSQFITEQKLYRSFDKEVENCVSILNTDRIVTISWLRHTWKTQMIHSLLKKTQSFSSSFYFNWELDELKSIKNREDMTILFDLFVRIWNIPKIVILQNINHISKIKSFITDLYKTGKYKIILIGNTLHVDGAKNIEVFPLWIDIQKISNTHLWGLPPVRIVPDITYKRFLLQNMRSDILMQEIIKVYTVKNIWSLTWLLNYLAWNDTCQSLREIHRNLSNHWLDISLLTMIDYINACVTAKILSRCYMYDIKNNNTITSKAKYYFWDVWLRSSFDTSFHPLENLLDLEFKMHWYDVSWWINGRFSFAFYAKKWDKILATTLDESWDKSEIRKTARKLEKIGDSSQKFVIVQNKNSLWMRKFVEWFVRIVELSEFLREI